VPASAIGAPLDPLLLVPLRLDPLLPKPPAPLPLEPLLPLDPPIAMPDPPPSALDAAAGGLALVELHANGVVAMNANHPRPRTHPCR
jgi:hypothetical protein